MICTMCIYRQIYRDQMWISGCPRLVGRGWRRADEYRMSFWGDEKKLL